MVNCFREVKKIVGDKLSDQELRDVEKYYRTRHGSGINIKKAASMTIEELNIQREMRAQSAARNRIVDRRNKELIGNFGKVESASQAKNILNGRLDTTEVPFKGGGQSVKNLREAFKGRLVNTLKYRFDEFQDIVGMADMEIEVARLADAEFRGDDISKFGPEVKAYKESLDAVNRQMRVIALENDLPFATKDKYFMRHTHDAEKLSKVSADEWADAVYTRLDKEQPFVGEALDEIEAKKRLIALHDDIITTNYDSLKSAPGGFGGQRTLNFSSEEEWFNYNLEFGRGSLLNTMESAIKSFSKQMSARSVFGSDPEKGFIKFYNNVVEGIPRANRTTALGEDYVPAKTVQEMPRSVRGLYAETFGYDTETPAGNILVSANRWIGTLESASKLGASLISTLPDASFNSIYFRQLIGTGSALDSFGVLFDTFKLMSKSRDKGVNRWARRFEMSFDHQLSTRFDDMGDFSGGGTGTLPGKAFQKVIDFTGLNKQSASNKVVLAQNISNYLADELMDNVEFRKLPPGTKALLEKAGIVEKEWFELSRAVTQVEGTNYLDVNFGRENGVSSNLSTKMAVLFNDATSLITPEATGVERGAVFGGASVEDPLGFFLRTVTRFKWATMAMPRIYRAAAQANPDFTGNQLLNAIRLKPEHQVYGAIMAEATVLALMGMYARDALKGEYRDPRENTGDLLAEAATRGAMPLMGSYMVDAWRGEYAKYGRSFLKDLSGPTLSSINDVVALLSGEVGMNSKTGLKALNIMMRYAPGKNIPFVGPAIYGSFLEQLHETFNPGYSLRRQLRRHKQGYREIEIPFAR